MDINSHSPCIFSNTPNVFEKIIKYVLYFNNLYMDKSHILNIIYMNIFYP